MDNDKIKEWLLLNHRQQYATHFNSIVLPVMAACSPNAFVKVFHLYLNNKQIVKMSKNGFIGNYKSVVETINTYEGFKTKELMDIMNKVREEFEFDEKI